MAKKKIYAVKKGRKTGIFYDWDSCREQIFQFKGAIYQSFSSEEEANDYLNDVFEKPENPEKFYAIRKGRQTGIFYHWPECLSHVSGFKNAQYASFKTLDAAENYLKNGPSENAEAAQTLKEVMALTSRLSKDPNLCVVYVDGSNNPTDKDGNKPTTGVSFYAYGLVHVKNDEIVHEEGGSSHHEHASDLQNVAGELLGAMKAVLFAMNVVKTKHLVLFFDYAGIELWVTEAWSSKNPMVLKYIEFMQAASQKLNIEFIKVDGHSKNKYNDRADDMARLALGLTPRKVRYDA